MSGKKSGGDKKAREKVNRRNPRKNKKGGKISRIRGRNTFLLKRRK